MEYMEDEHTKLVEHADFLENSYQETLQEREDLTEQLRIMKEDIKFN